MDPSYIFLEQKKTHQEETVSQREGSNTNLGINFNDSIFQLKIEVATVKLIKINQIRMSCYEFSQNIYYAIIYYSEQECEYEV